MLLPEGEVLLFKLGDKPIQLSRESGMKCPEWREEEEKNVLSVHSDLIFLWL